MFAETTVQYATLFAIAVVNFIIAVFVLRKNPKRIVNQAFFVFAVGAALWIAGVTALFATHQFIFNDVLFYGALLILAGLVLFAKVFPGAERVSRRFWLVFLPLAALVIAVPFDIFVEGIAVDARGAISPVNGPAMPIFAVASLCYLFYSVFLFVQTYRGARGIVRAQIQYLFAGAILFVLSGILFDILLPTLGIFRFNLLGPASSIFFIGATAYAIIRYQLMDIRVVIQRGVIYTAFAATVLSLYFVLTLLLGAFVTQTVGVVSSASAALAAVIVVLSYRRLDNFLREITDQVFFKKHYRSPEVLQRVSAILNSTLDFSRVIVQVSELLKDVVKVPRIYFFIYAEDRLALFSVDHEVRTVSTRSLERKLTAFFPSCISNIREGVCLDDLEVLSKVTEANHPCAQTPEVPRKLLEVLRAFNLQLLIPIFTKDALSGVMALGLKRSGDRFTPQDRELLNAIVHQLGIAIENFRLYEAQQRYAASLEQEVEKRTGELTRLYETQMRLIQDLSHALQTPLAVVKSAIDAELTTRSPKGDGNMIRSLEQTCADMSKIIRRILVLARSETELETFARVPVSLLELLRDLGEQMSILAKDKGVRFHIDISDHTTVMGDREKLRELFAELLANALKYTPRGGTIRLTLSGRKKIAEVLVADTGYGISPKDLPYIFDRFYKAKTPKRSGGEGIGLGLAIAESIAKAHQGKILVESTLGKGSTFTVRLPRTSRKTTPTAAARKRPRRAGGKRAKGSPK